MGSRLTGRSYVLAWLALVVLTSMSLGATFLPLSIVAAEALALGLATVKAVIVALVFMHLLEARFAVKAIAATVFLFIVILCLGIAADVAARRPPPPVAPPPIADVADVAEPAGAPAR
jgi:cytochrome c oxidase subunit IV